MATLSLKNRHAQTIAQVEDDKVELVDTGQTATVGGQESRLVQVAPLPEAPPETPAVAAWVPEDELSEWNVRSVSIPANFAGMEAIAIPTRLKPQLFDITEVVENEDYVEITALHMFYRLADNMTLWKPTEGLSYTGAAACRNVMTNELSPSSFMVASDCTDTRPGDEMDYERRNIVETFLDPESGICARYDLSMIRDNDTFYCLKDVGYDRGFLIENGKNLLGVERRVNIENLVTRVAPVGRDEEGEYVWLNRNGLKYVDSPHINDYTTPKAEVYYTDLTIGENGVTAENIQQKLYEEALTRFSIDEADIPEVTMTIQFVCLGDTEEYKQYKDLDKVYLYDILTIKDKIRGYNYAAQVVGVEHNILTGMLESVTIGHLTETDGTRKIATWKVPEINGHKVRHKSIRAGSYERNSVHADDLADNSIESRHFGGGANNHFKALFAEELYISNTSEDGLLNTRFTVAEGLIQGEIIQRTAQGEELGSRLTQTSEAIQSEVYRASSSEGVLRSQILQTATMIYSSVEANNSLIYSEVIQTANEIRSQVSNALSDFYTAIIQTASEIIIRTGDNTKTFHQRTAPTGTEDEPLVDGDVWFDGIGQFLWGDVADKTWIEDTEFEWGEVGANSIYRYDGNADRWVQVSNERALMQDTRFEQNKEQIHAVAARVDVVRGEVYSYRTEFHVEADGIRASLSEARQQLSSSLQVTAQELKSDYVDKINGTESHITQTASEIRMEVRNTNSQMYSLIQQNAQGITMRVAKGQVISEINQTAEQVKISAGKIDLSGYVTASQLQTTNATISNLMSGYSTATELSAANLRCSNFYLGGNRIYSSYPVMTTGGNIIYALGHG